MLVIISNGSKFAGEKPDSIDELCSVLQKEPLDPIFEDYGNFVNRNPSWCKRDGTPSTESPYLGCTKLWGNFRHYSHVFEIITDEEKTINRLEKLIRANQATPAYQAIKRAVVDAKLVTLKVEQSSSGWWYGSIVFADGEKRVTCAPSKTKKLAEQKTRKMIPTGYKERVEQA